MVKLRLNVQSSPQYHLTLAEMLRDAVLREGEKLAQEIMGSSDARIPFSDKHAQLLAVGELEEEKAEVEKCIKAAEKIRTEWEDRQKPPEDKKFSEQDQLGKAEENKEEVKVEAI